MFSLSPWIDQQFLDNNGNPLSFGKIETYIAGSSTQLKTYTDSTGTTENTNPIILDSTGRADIWLSNSSNYKFIIKDSNDTIIRTVDNVEPVGGGSSGSNTDQYVKITSADTTSDYLNAKIIAGSNITTQVQSLSGVESLLISAGNSNWDNVYTSVNSTSGNWDSVYSSVNTTSGNWDSTYTTVNANSASWQVGGSDTQVQFNDSGAFGGDSTFTFNKTSNELSLDGVFRHYKAFIQYKQDSADLRDHSILVRTGTSGSSSVNSQRIYTVGDGLLGIDEFGISNFITGTSTRVKQLYIDNSDNSVHVPSGLIYDGSSNSGLWASTYTTVNTNSASWNNVYTTVNSNSADWSSTYTTVNANSAVWSSGLQTLQEVTELGNTTDQGIIITSGVDNGNGNEFITLSGNSPQVMKVGNGDGSGFFFLTNDQGLGWPNGGSSIEINDDTITLNPAAGKSQFEASPSIVTLRAGDPVDNPTSLTLTSGFQAGFNTAVSGSDPVIAQDFVTKTYYDTNTANANSAYTTVNSNSADWQSTYTTVSANSADWAGGGGSGQIQTCNLTNVNGVVSFGSSSTQYPRYTYFAASSDVLELDRMKVFVYSVTGSIDYEFGIYQVSGSNLSKITSQTVTITSTGLVDITFPTQFDLTAGVSYYIGAIRQTTSGDVQLGVESNLSSDVISFQGAGITTPFALPSLESTKTPINYSLFAFLYASAGGSSSPDLWSTITVTSDHSATRNQMILCDTSSNPLTVTLPLASININRQISIKKISNDSNSVTISATGSDLVDGLTDIGLKTENSSITTISNGSAWYIR